MVLGSLNVWNHWNGLQYYGGTAGTSTFLRRVKLGESVARPESRIACASGACGSSSYAQALDVSVNLSLQLPELLQRAFSEQGEVTWILREYLIAVGFEDTLHPSHLLDRLVQLFGCLNHNFTLRMPFFRPGRCLTC